MSRWTSLLLAAATAVAAMQAAPLRAQPEKGGQAPPFDLPTLAGDQMSLADLRGQFVVLHFGTGW